MNIIHITVSSRYDDTELFSSNQGRLWTLHDFKKVKTAIETNKSLVDLSFDLKRSCKTIIGWLLKVKDTTLFKNTVGELKRDIIQKYIKNNINLDGFHHITKEQIIVDELLFLISEILNKHNLDYVRNRPVGNSKRRPDLCINLKSYWICIENDENEHRDKFFYSEKDEDERIKQLYNDMKCIPMILIRFNCDSYKKTKGMFNKDHHRNITINSDIFKKRINSLVNCVVKHIENKPLTNSIIKRYLYYRKI